MTRELQQYNMYNFKLTGIGSELFSLCSGIGSDLPFSSGIGSDPPSLCSGSELLLFFLPELLLFCSTIGSELLSLSYLEQPSFSKKQEKLNNAAACFEMLVAHIWLCLTKKLTQYVPDKMSSLLPGALLFVNILSKEMISGR